MIYILGNGPFAKELQMYCVDEFKIMPSLIGKNETYPENHSLVPTKWHGTYLGSGKPSVKIAMLQQMVGPPASTLKLGHFSKFSTHGSGSVFAPGSVVSSKVSLGNHILINYNASVGHDCTIDDFVSIGPNAAIGGNVHLKKGAYIGAGALIRENLVIGEGATVGMGAVVTKNVPDGVTVCGVPAKPVTIIGGWR